MTTQRSKVVHHLFVGFSVCSCPIELCLVLFVTLKMLFEMTFNSSSVYLLRKKNFSCLPQTGDFLIYLFGGDYPKTPLVNPRCPVRRQGCLSQARKTVEA